MDGLNWKQRLLIIAVVLCSAAVALGVGWLLGKGADATLLPYTTYAETMADPFYAMARQIEENATGLDVLYVGPVKDFLAIIIAMTEDDADLDAAAYTLSRAIERIQPDEPLTVLIAFCAERTDGGYDAFFSVTCPAELFPWLAEHEEPLDITGHCLPEQAEGPILPEYTKWLGTEDLEKPPLYDIWKQLNELKISLPQGR